MKHSLTQLIVCGLFISACGSAPELPTLAPTLARATDAPKVVVTEATPLPTVAVEETSATNPIIILAPGAGSALISSVAVVGVADPTFEQSLLIRITDANGQNVGESPTIIQADIGQRGPFNVEVPFAVSGDQLGRVSVFSHSALDGGVVNLASVEVLLRASGSAEVIPGLATAAPIIFTQPEALATIIGGSITVAGTADPALLPQMGVVVCGETYSGDPDALCGSTGNVLAAALVTANGEAFSAQLTVTVTASQTARVVVYVTSPRDGGLIAVNSRLVRLEP